MFFAFLHRCSRAADVTVPSAALPSAAGRAFDAKALLLEVLSPNKKRKAIALRFFAYRF